MQHTWERIELIDQTFEMFGLKTNNCNKFIESLLASIVWIILTFSIYTIDVMGHLEDWKLLPSLYCVFYFHWALHTNTVVDISFALALR